MRQLPERILSIDVLRAITMFLMIFVNDVAGVANLPAWIEHTPADYDGMGFSDVIFPAFLFIVGLSLPFAIQARLNRGHSLWSIAFYIITRAFALIVMGFFHVNLDNYNSNLAVLSHSVYVIILTTSFFLIWLDYPETLNKAWRYVLITVGVIILGFLAYLYKGGTAENPVGLQPQWWGILGIIGWAYFFAALAYLLSKGKMSLLLSAFLVSAVINITTHMKLLQVDLWQIGDASSITLMLGGAVIATAYRLNVGKGKDARLWLILAGTGLGAVVFGLFIRPFAGGISKIYATPAWVFICMGITILFFMMLVYLIDYRAKKDWFVLIKPAGTSTLTCYLVPYILYSVFSLIEFNYPAFLNIGTGGIIRSLFIALLVIRIVALMEPKHLRLRV